MFKNSNSAIDKALKKCIKISQRDYPKVVLMSDCHRGIGNRSDNFLPNRVLYIAALKYYYKKDYAYIELGDGDELWENKRLSTIYTVYQELYSLLLDFHKKNRLFMVFGNHDRVKEKLKYITLCSNYKIPFYESLLLTGKVDIHMLHGHQGDLINDKLWKLSRFVVRYGWSPLEVLGFSDPTGAALNYRYRNLSERRLEDWTKVNDKFLIAGHTHKATLSSKSKYLNCGSCVPPEAITAMEITKEKISLVKWAICTDEAMRLYVCRKVLNTMDI